MAEASSSGGESSEEDEQDEASPSRRRGPVSSITAATRPPHPNQTKKLRYVQDCLQRIPKHQRPRIQQEIDKGFKPALTVDNIITVLRGIHWGKVGRDILNLPGSIYAEITEQSSSYDDRVRAGVREWLFRDPVASWRRLIDWLYMQEEAERADTIVHYAEELTDTTLTHSNLFTVLNHVVDMDNLMDCLNIPGSVRKKIRKCSRSVEQQQHECVAYWRNLSPYSMLGWGFLGGSLHYKRQETAIRAANEYIQKAPEPTLTVDNLTAVLNSVQGKIYWITLWLHIPESKQGEIRLLYDRGQVNKGYAEYFISHHSAPSWTIAANALWLHCEAGALEMVQKLYLKGTSESRRLFQQSMKQGHVDMYSDKMLLYGSTGVGKTCTMKIVAGQKPPAVRNSTPLATRPVTMYQLQIMKGKWYKYVSKDRMKICTRISKTTLGRDVINAINKAKMEAAQQALHQEVDGGSEQKTSTSASHQQPTRDTIRQGEDPTPKMNPSTASSRQSIDPNVLQVIHDVLDEMFQLIDECSETEEPLTFIHKLLVSDCGGQPQFHEVLPIFLRRMSLIMFIFKLSENLSSRPMIEYYEDGKPLTRETKNQKLSDMLLPTFEKEIIYYQPGTNQVLFPMNAKCPGKEEEDMAQAIVSRFSTENRSDKRQLPLQWLGFEIMLEEITQRLERGILSRSECLEITYRLHLDEGALDAALIYLDELSLIFYYPNILPEIVFTNPQVVLDKISELVKVHHDRLHKFSGENWQKFFCHALVSIDFLTQKEFEKHYVPGLFDPEHLVLLYRKLLIFADFSEGKFFVPSLLRMLSCQELSTHRLSLESLVAPIVLHFPDGPPRRGIFCALVSFLTSPENHYPHQWKLKKPARSVTPDCLYRNCIQFTIPGADTPCCVTVIDTLLHFEVHVDISEQPESDFCSSIKCAITAGLQKANLTLGYTNSTPSFAFLCPCGEGEPHPAKIGKKSWICTLNEVKGKKFSPNQLVWIDEPTPGSEPKTGTQTSEVKGDNNGHSVNVTMLSVKPGDTSGDIDDNQDSRKPTPHSHDGLSTTAPGTSTVPAELTLQDVASQAGLQRLDILDQECSPEVLLTLAKHCVDWKLIGLYLKLTDGDIAAVDGDNRTVDEKRVGMLRRWKEQFAFKATYLLLVNALLTCRRASDAVHACKTIVSGIGALFQQVSSMSEDEFFKWLKQRGVSDKDCKTLSENGVTPIMFIRADAKDFEDIGLTKFGKQCVLELLAQVKAASRSF